MTTFNINNSDENIIFNGQTITDIPEDLFIPPEALRVIIEQFEGPLDLLLYLIKKQNISGHFLQITKGNGLPYSPFR